MSLFFGNREEQRAVDPSMWITGDDVGRIYPSDMASSLAIVPVFASCRLIADSISTLPLQAFRKSGDVRTSITIPSAFDRPDRIAWTQKALMSMLLAGQAIGYDTSVNALRGNVEWLNPERIDLDETFGKRPVWHYEGRELDAERVIQIPAYTLPGSIAGVSPIRACSMLATTGNATQRMMRDWFNGRSIPGVTMKNSQKTLTPGEADAVSERLSARLRNGRPFVHGADWDITVMSMPADDAGFVSSSKLNATQVASIYGVPPHMIGGEVGNSLTYSTVELNQIQFLTNTLRPWIAKLEEAFSSWLPRPQFVRFNTDAMIRVDTKTRYEVHQIARNIGLNNIDELRSLEDEPPLPDGQGQDYSPLLAKAVGTTPPPA